MNTNELVYRAVLRDFRNAVVSYVRVRLKEAYPDSWAEQVRRPFTGDEWQRMEESVKQLSAVPFAAVRHRDDFDYLGVNHLQNLFQLHAPILVSAEGFSSVGAAKRKESLLQLLREIKAVRDVIAHPGSTDLSPQDAYRVIDSARRVLMILRLPEARRLQRIQRQVLTAPSVSNALSARSPARKTHREQLPVASHGDLRMPAFLTPLIGRERQLEEIRRFVLKRGIRLLTLIGPGGVGKTRLAVEAAERLRADFPDGVVWVPLEHSSEPSDVPRVLSTGLDLVPDHSGSLTEALYAHLKAKRMLLILDNFEQLLSAKEVVYDLLAACTTIRAIVTSRAPLDVLGEQQYEVPVLDLPERGSTPHVEDLHEYPAVALLLERVRAVRPRFRLTNANAEDFVEICRRLDGLPLALELIAARLRYLSPGQALEDLNNQLVRSRSRKPGVVPRQRTLEQTMEWSYGLLKEREKLVFRRVSLFVDGFYPEAASTICHLGREWDINAILESLLTNSLLTAEGQRYRMLATVNQFAAEKLVASGDGARAVEAFLDWCAEFCRSAVEKDGGPLFEEGGNLSLALRLTETMAGRLPVKSLAFVSEFGYALFGEGLTDFRDQVKQVLTRMLARHRSLPAATRARAFYVAALLCADDTNDQARSYFRNSAKLWLEAGKIRSAVDCLEDFASYLRYHHSDKAAIPPVEKRLSLLKRLGDRPGVSAALLELAELTFDAERFIQEWVELVWRGLKEASTDYDAPPVKASSNADAVCEVKALRRPASPSLVKAYQLERRALALLRDRRDKSTRQDAFLRLAATSICRQKYGEALEFLEKANLGSIDDGGKPYLAEEHPWRYSNTPLSVRVLPLSIRLFSALTETERIRSWSTVWRPILIALAQAACDRNEFTKAARLVGASRRSFRKGPIPTKHSKASEEVVRRIRDELGNGACALAISEGADMGLDEALWYCYSSQ